MRLASTWGVRDPSRPIASLAVGLVTVALLTVTLPVVGCGAASTSSQGSPAERASASLRRIVEQRQAPGISYAVVSAEGIVFEGHAGRVDAATDRRVSAATLYMAYSMTKALTAVLVMRLQERGLMALDVPLSTYFHDHPFGDEVTIRMLLAHTGGIPAPAPLDWFCLEVERCDSAAELARVMEESDELQAAPGAEYAYTNLGYWLLERAVEGATSRRFAEVMRTEVFAPLDITADGATFDLPPVGRLATGHIRKWSATNALLHVISPSRYWGRARDGWSRFERVRSHGLAYGGLHATSGAFAAVLCDLLRDDSTLLSRASRDAMFAAQRTSSGEGVGGALGWVHGQLGEVAYLGKQGGGMGFHGNLRIYPSVGLATVFLANSTEITPGPIDARSDALDAPFIEGAGP